MQVINSVFKVELDFWKTLFFMFKFATRDCHATFILTWNLIKKKMQTKMARKWLISFYQQFSMPLMRSTLFKETMIGLLNLILQHKVCLTNRLTQSYMELCYKKPYFLQLHYGIRCVSAAYLLLLTHLSPRSKLSIQLDSQVMD